MFLREYHSLASASQLFSAISSYSAYRVESRGGRKVNGPITKSIPITDHYSYLFLIKNIIHVEYT